jgi:hypothetical protein
MTHGVATNAEPSLPPGDAPPGLVQAQGSLAELQAPPPPAPRTKWTRRVPHLVLIGHAASLTPY